MDTKVTIFYSWQSDLPKETNLNAIRQSLRIAANDVENDLKNISIDLDEATRKTAGSPNIPFTIFEKISNADIFICDLTTINKNAENRKVPNPNVLIELGYAISELGWNRIVLLFNTVHGDFPEDLPFDVDRHRTTKFSIKNKEDKNGRSQLSKMLELSIKTIIELEPIKSSTQKGINKEERKRNLDLGNLKWCLKYLHIPTMDLFLEEFPSRIIKHIFHYQNAFKDIVDSSSFHIYDEKLNAHIKALNEKWAITLSFGHQYDPDRYANFYNYYLPMDNFQNEKSEKEYNYLMKIREKLLNIFKEFLLYLRNEYLEINLDETSNLALEIYNKELK